MSKHIALFSFLSLSWLLLTSCRQEASPTPRNYPRVRTLPVAMTAAGANFTGEIFFATADGITDHGFVWSALSGPSVGNGYTQTSLGVKAGTGRFSALVKQNFQYGQSYYVRAYAKNGTHTVYGMEQTFTPPQ